MRYDKANDKVMLVKCNSGYFSLQAFKPLEHVYPARAQHSKVEVIEQDPWGRILAVGLIYRKSEHAHTNATHATLTTVEIAFLDVYFLFYSILFQQTMQRFPSLKYCSCMLKI